jgi:hypothetical protein
MKIEEAIKIMKTCRKEAQRRAGLTGEGWIDLALAYDTIITFAEQHKKPSREEIEKFLSQWNISEELGLKYKLSQALLDKFWGRRENECNRAQIYNI